MQRVIAGVDGCGREWLAVIQGDQGVEARIVPHLEKLLDTLPDVLIGIDVPIGLPNQGSRTCDVLARKLLGRPRQSSVFPAPIRACLKEGDHPTLSSLQRSTDGRGLTIQAFHLLPKIRQVDDLLQRLALSDRIREVHPEVFNR